MLQHSREPAPRESVDKKAVWTCERIYQVRHAAAISKEAAGGGFYDSPGWKTRHPRMQILTVAELLEGKTIDMPPVGQVSVTFKKAAKAKADMPDQLALED